MSDDSIRTRVDTPGGELAFHEYFVRQRCGTRGDGCALQLAAELV
jgi:hypothetical protein